MYFLTASQSTNCGVRDFIIHSNVWTRIYRIIYPIPITISCISKLHIFYDQKSPIHGSRSCGAQNGLVITGNKLLIPQD
jgi:hypothetical protein